MNDGEREQLKNLLLGGYACLRVQTVEEGYVLELLRDAAMALGRDLWIWSANGGVREGLLSDSRPVGGTDAPVKGLNWMRHCAKRPICVALDLCGHLGDASTLRALRDLIGDFERGAGQLVLVDHSDNVPAVIRAHSMPLEIALPSTDALEQIVRDTLRRAHRERPIEIDINRAELDVIVRNLRGLSRRQAERLIAEAVAHDRRLDAHDINHLLAGKRRMIAADGLLDYVEAPVGLGEIGGLRRLKRWLALRAHALSDKASAFGLAAPRGVLMLGVQGAGKSLCAKAVATAWQRPLLRMDVGALYDKYVGSSEARLRDALRQAERMAPIVLWIDEIEKAFASAAAQSTDGGLSKRMFGSLLTWMQEHAAPVFLVATANDIEALPPELLRKGRFDEIFFVDLPPADVRSEIFAIHLRRRGRDPATFDLERLAQASDGFSGAEIEQAVLAGLHDAFAAKTELTTAHLERALEQTTPLSVTMSARIDALRGWAHGRCVPAD